MCEYFFLDNSGGGCFNELFMKASFNGLSRGHSEMWNEEADMLGQYEMFFYLNLMQSSNNNGDVNLEQQGIISSTVYYAGKLLYELREWS